MSGDNLAPVHACLPPKMISKCGSSEHVDEPGTGRHTRLAFPIPKDLDLESPYCFEILHARFGKTFGNLAFG